MSKILIATPLYPPDIGGPAQYAQQLAAVWQAGGHRVRVVVFGWERHLPAGLRHLVFGFRLLPGLWRCDWCLALDGFSVSWPAVLVGTLIGRPVLIRLGGDFLWESYVERTGEPVLLRQFYQTTQSRWSRKERLIFNLIRWTFRRASKIVFSTRWQQEIFAGPYQLSPEKVMVIENYYGPKEVSFAPSQKNFIAASRPLQLKNLNLLREVFAELPTATLDTRPAAPAEFLERLKRCYAVVVVSWSEVSPNLILEAIRYNKPFILTRESGLAEQLQGVGLIVNPLDRVEIIQAIEYLLNDTSYSQAIEKVRQFKVIHDWSMIADEFIKVAKTL